MQPASQSHIVIRVHQVGKVYRIYDKPQDRLKQMLFARFGKSYGRDFCALQDVSFEVRRGEAVGIIGRNGSGKSTLLQVLAGTLAPSWGEVQVQGRVAALLELGSGFNPEFTGRENVHLAATIAGLSHRQSVERFDEIVSFADIGEYLEQPVKTYSSGMMMRLAFAVQTAVNPDILIVDEALSVGDFFFAQKCARRIKDMVSLGTTLLFVSHDMSLVRDLCPQALYLEGGRMAFAGPSDRAIARFFQSGSQSSNGHLPKLTPVADPHELGWWDQVKSGACWICTESEPESAARIIAVSVLDPYGRPVQDARLGQRLTFQVVYRTFTEKPVHVSVSFKNRFDQVIYTGGSYTEGIEPPRLEPGQYSIFQATLTCMIEAGNYSYRLYLGTAGDDLNRGCGLHATPWLGPLKILWDYESQRAPFFGMFGIPADVEFLSLDGQTQGLSDQQQSSDH